MAHDDGCSIESLDGFFQHILRLHVEVVGRLIENEEIHRFEQELDHRQSAAFSSTQNLDKLLRSLAAKHEGAQEIVHLQTHFACCHIVDSLEDGKILIQELRLILGEITNLHIMTNLESSGERNLTHDTFYQGRLTLAVLTHESHLLATLDGKGNMVEDGVGAVILAHLIADDRIIATSEARREFEVHLLVVNLIHLDRHDFLELLDSALHLNRLGRLVAESLDEILDVGNFLLLVFVSTELLLAAFGTQHHILIVFHLIVFYPSASNFEGTVSYIVDESTVVAHQNHSLSTLRQKLLQPLDTFNIKVIGRLIEEQYIRLLQQNLGKFDTHSPTAGKLLGRALEIIARKAKTAQGALYLSLIVFATHHHVAFMFLGKLLYELSIAFALIVGAVGHFLLHLVQTRLHLGIMGESLAGFLFHGRIVLQFHHLWQIADCGFVRNSHNAVSRFLQTAENLEHRRFSCTILTHQGNAVAVVDDETYIMKERLDAKLYFQSFY